MAGRALTTARKLYSLKGERDLNEEEQARYAHCLKELGLPEDHKFVGPPARSKPPAQDPEPPGPIIDWEQIDIRALLPYDTELDAGDVAGVSRREQMDALLLGIMRYGLHTLGYSALQFNSTHPDNPINMITVSDWLKEETTIDNFATRAGHAHTIYRASLTARLNDRADRDSSPTSLIALNNAFNSDHFTYGKGSKNGQGDEKEKVNALEMYNTAAEAAGRALLEFSGEDVE